MIIKRKQYVEALLWHTLVAFVAPVVHVVSVVVRKRPLSMRFSALCPVFTEAESPQDLYGFCGLSAFLPYDIARGVIICFRSVLSAAV